MKLEDYKSSAFTSKNPAILSFVESSSHIVKKLETIELGETIELRDGKVFTPIHYRFTVSREIGEGPARVAMVAAAITKQIQFPKTKAIGKDGQIKQAGEPRQLSNADIQDIIGIVSETLALHGAFTGHTDDEGKLSRNIWEDCFNAVRKNVTGLNLNVKDTFDLSELYQNSFKLRGPSKRRIVKRKRQLEKLIHASFNADPSRQRLHNLNKALSLLESAFSLAMGNGTESLPDAFRAALHYSDTATQEERDKSSELAFKYREKQKAFFLSYVKRGREALKSASEAPAIENPVIR
jgi:hypothetical protein